MTIPEAAIEAARQALIQAARDEDGFEESAIAALEAAAPFMQQPEVDRLNKWADGFSDAQLKERKLAEERIQELQRRNNKLAGQIGEMVAAGTFADGLEAAAQEAEKHWPLDGKGRQIAAAIRAIAPPEQTDD